MYHYLVYILRNSGVCYKAAGSLTAVLVVEADCTSKISCRNELGVKLVSIVAE